MKISGQPVANLVASTSGTDSDWVVKLIDVYPDEVAAQPEMGGYQLMVSADIFRGRYRESLETPKADRGRTSPSPTASRCPTANHVFLPGHRIMVQVQSSWFPLYDRNPQTFVPSIFWAKPGRLSQGRAARLPRARSGELRGAADGGHALAVAPSRTAIEHRAQRSAAADGVGAERRARARSGISMRSRKAATSPGSVISARYSCW